MSKEKFEYTTFAHRYTARYPLLTYLGIQVNFWIIANLLLATIIHIHSKVHNLVSNSDVIVGFEVIVWIAVIFGVLYGTSYGLFGYFLEKRVFKKLSIGKVILFKAAASLTLLMILLVLLRGISEKLLAHTSVLPMTVLSDEVWRYVFYLLLVYYFFMALLINYINLVNKKYGPGVLIPLLFGKYRHPREEDRIFMFMDLKSSTATAELLGHLRYSSFIRDCFDDINELLFPFRAQIYQYVGDEIVLMWPEREGLLNNFCIRFFFACRKQFLHRSEHYMTNYGVIPEFKAGLHAGQVSAVEIGEVKKDIAYHGDTLNTAARIQSVCNQYNQSLLISEYLLNKAALNDDIKSSKIGDILLRGKKEPIGVFCLTSVEDGK
ncbi:adenylate/guanylate cyclase domain-containing protein [Fulvivirga ulvae]|uniref:adenylate/guanylate cyclase domain-containing protein n=1 Tax=Fulvivirga ulvae TaxID=2904245 RepID=UPI001F3F7B2F|nr:adenylate/guanylate cyclase domain-containing protein [Fulvivirga ulvae]UII29664.1 adenylate/guanylate cyclase domain-containing protein [Fulvivirga ulvae]